MLGNWTGPDSWNGPDHDRPGEADAHVATALTDYPAGNTHMHTGPLRALMGVLGIDGDGGRLRLAPRLPTETFAVRWPRLRLDGAPDRLAGAFIPSGAGGFTLELLLPSGLRGGSPVVAIDGAPAAFTRDGDLVAIAVVGQAGVPLEFELSLAPR